MSMLHKIYVSLPLLIPSIILFSMAFVAQPFQLYLLSSALLFPMFALSLDFLVGYGGMPNFGHAMFFGLGAYLTVIGQVWFKLPWVVSLLLPYIFVVPLSFFLAYFTIRRGGIYFALITLIWGDIMYNIFFYEWTLGGADGLRGATIFPLQPYYIVILILTLICYILLKRLTNSHFGKILQAIRENEVRVGFVGCNTYNYKTIATVISACFAAFAGSLYPALYGGARPELLHWTLSTLGMSMVIIGGLGTLVGALIGGFLITLVIDFATSYLPTGGGFSIVGLLLIFTLRFMPKGIYYSIKEIIVSRLKVFRL